jgi:hypothetical protein
MLCRRGGVTGKCASLSVLQWWDYNRTRIEIDPDVITTMSVMTMDANGHPLLLNDVLGGLTRADDGTPIGATAYAVYVCTVDCLHLPVHLGFDLRNGVRCVRVHNCLSLHVHLG